MSASVILVPLFQRLGFGSVLGYLMAGVLVGPQGLRLIEDPEAITHFSEFGVVFLLFIIGLEIQPRKLWAMRRHLLGLGGMQIGLCTLAFMGIAMAFGMSAAGAAVVGFALSLSSTAFAVQTLVEKNVFNTEFGRASFAVLLMQDLVAIPALAVIPLLAAPGAQLEGPPPDWKFAVLLVAALVFASRFLIRPIFRLIASTRSREVFTAVTLFIAVGVAVLMQQAGFSAALGTFIAGVLLADSEYRHELESDVEPFKGLLMGLFFIGVGMNVSVDLIMSKPAQVLGLAVGYFVLKSFIIYAAARFFHMGHTGSKMVALNIAQGGEFAFVIFGIVTHLHLVPSEFLALLTVAITLSMALSPLVNLFNDYLVERLKKVIEPNYDAIPDEGVDVIIAGFGRFGQIFGRILRAQGIPFVAIDHDPNQIELLRRFGNTVYYGDASRKDLLESAGASHAKYLILAIDDIEASLQTVRLVREQYPQIKIFARARNRGHLFDLMDMNVGFIKRETFESSLSFVEEFLVEMGYEKTRAQTIIDRFREHDEIMVQEQYKVRKDDATLISVSKQGSQQLAQVLNDDSMRTHISIPEKKTAKFTSPSP